MLENWMKVSLLLCIFGFFREIRPIEPFTIEYFIREKNITRNEIIHDLYPWGTYAYLFQIIVVFLVTDALRYKPVILLSAVAGSMIFALLAWTNSFVGLLLAQIFYGTYMATEIAYFTYIYTKVERKKYQLVTGQTRAAKLVGSFLGCTLSQVLVSFGLMSYFGLTLLSFVIQCSTLIWALLLPSVDKSLYFYSSSHQSNETGIVKNIQNIVPHGISTVENMKKQLDNANSGEMAINESNVDRTIVPTFSVSTAFAQLATQFKTSYSNPAVIKWSIWWAIATCGYLQILSYSQILWSTVGKNEPHLYNGAAEAGNTLFGAFGALVAGLITAKNFKHYETWILTLFTVIDGLLMLWGAMTTSLWECYWSYVLFGGFYHFMITIASAAIAKKLKEECFALVFGINTLFALILQSSLTFVVIVILKLDIRMQYQVYGYWFLVLSVLYGIIFGMKCHVKR